jgi:nucleotide-binding universal stress UspA family protein
MPYRDLDKVTESIFLEGMEAGVFRRILVAMDESEAARSAFVFVSDWARQFDAKVWFIQLTDEIGWHRCALRTDVSRRGRQLANRFTVSGATKASRNSQLASAIAEAAESFGAEAIVLGFEPTRLANHRHGPSVRERLTTATSIPVIVAPPSVSNHPSVATRRASSVPTASPARSGERAGSV